MDRGLRGLVGALKDTASLSKAAAGSATSPSSAANLAVIRATTYFPSAEPPSSRRIEALLAFGHGSRLSAGAVAGALAARLRSTRDPAVALKSLLALHHLLARGAFILRDQLPAALIRHPSSGRNALALANFPHGSSPSSWALAAWVRWYARLLEILLLLTADDVSLFSGRHHHRPLAKAEADEDRLTSMLNQDIVSELESLVGIVEEMCRSPEMVAVEGNKLIAEVVRLVEEDRATAEHEILIRVKELTHRLGSLGFADSVELVWLLRRLEECRYRPFGRKPTAEDWYWAVIKGLKDRVEEAVVEREEQERGKIRREKASASARIVVDRTSFGSNRTLGFVSTRWGLTVDRS